MPHGTICDQQHAFDRSKTSTRTGGRGHAEEVIERKRTGGIVERIDRAGAAQVIREVLNGSLHRHIKSINVKV